MLGLGGATPGGVGPVAWSGDLGNAAGSSLTVTGTTRTATVPSGNSGVLSVSNVVTAGDGATGYEYSKNGSAWTALGVSLTVANGDTLQVRAHGMQLNDEDVLSLDDDTTGLLSQTTTFARTS